MWKTLFRRRPKPEPQTESPSFSERCQAFEIEALLAGDVSLSEYSNVAPGSYGGAVHALERRGYMGCRSVVRTPDGHVHWHYKLTPAGVAAAAMMRD